ncbi:hypothetical protein LUZ63_009884 [Rhynchospora breviuscula]|uniref:Galactose oxidase n=1 Tax=Rhynchospora breviuscula TaxID=2022672 RepID=A0A9Q0CFX2_9POAL|nr:hypothetical protein LUZ63_009884 [Rhynchospora breviuscula]
MDKNLNSIILLSAFLYLIVFLFTKTQALQNGGTWMLLKRSIGISAMHMAVLPNGHLVTFDRTEFGRSNISLPPRMCRNGHQDCTAHSVEFDPVTRAVHPLMVLTDTWCSSGTLLPNGTLLQTGGYFSGDRTIRYLSACDNCNWLEVPNGLSVRRWYATNHILPDGRVIVVGGRGQFSYEFVPKHDNQESVHALPFLYETKDRAENNLYPFVHLSTDGNLFIFANTKSILLDYVKNKVVRNFPEMPGGIARNYPSTGSSVLLPIWLSKENDSNLSAEVMICGGTSPDAYPLANSSNIFIPASDTCGRLVITAESPNWVIERMSIPRIMGDMVLLPTGRDVLIINGAGKGSAGWTLGREPVLQPVIYNIGSTEDKISPKFFIMNPSTIPRLYHSTAQLIPDGRVLVGGSNPNRLYEFSGVMYPTDLSLEAFLPPYFKAPRPKIVRIYSNDSRIGYGGKISIVFDKAAESKVTNDVMVTMIVPAFTTHSFAMSQRVLILSVDAVRNVGLLPSDRYVVDASSPASRTVAPPGYYMLFVVYGGVPSKGEWVQLI